MSELLAIAIRPAKGAPMQCLDQVQIDPQSGINGDHRSRPGKRQISVLSQASWLDACAELNQSIDWTIRRANLLVNLPGFGAGDVGKIIAIGEVRLRICIETDPCYKMDQQVAGLRAALESHWRGGVCCEVLQGGVIEPGMRCELLSA